MMRLKATLSGFVASSASVCLILVSLLAFSTQTHANSIGKTYFDEPNCEGRQLGFLPGDADPWAAEDLGADSYIEHGTCYNINANSYGERLACQAVIVGSAAAVIGGIGAVVGGPKGFIAGFVVGLVVGAGTMIISDAAGARCQGEISPA